MILCCFNGFKRNIKNNQSLIFTYITHLLTITIKTRHQNEGKNANISEFY